VKTLKVNLGQNSYEIKIGSGLLNMVGAELVNLGFKDQSIVITNPKVNHLWGERLNISLRGAGFKSLTIEVPDGEEYKSLEQAGALYARFNEFQAERTTPVLALGGGVIGDLAGFAAATYMRGMPLIQIPTTLLAQVDSSTGGKVAVNHGRLKNIIGNFYQPKLVIADTGTLRTLPPVELLNGLAEVIKYGVILDPDLFQGLEKGMQQLKSMDEEMLKEVIYRSVCLKAAVVEKDERDTGLRNILNYGHTVGHAIEAVSDFKIKHGQAVAIGIVAAGRISCKMGIIPESEKQRIESLIQKAGLPVKISDLDVTRIMDFMGHDKKKTNGKIRFILVKKIGEAFISDEVNSKLIEQVLRELI
jgi:3-dehydroquinate synthase